MGNGKYVVLQRFSYSKTFAEQFKEVRSTSCPSQECLVVDAILMSIASPPIRQSDS